MYFRMPTCGSEPPLIILSLVRVFVAGYTRQINQELTVNLHYLRESDAFVQAKKAIPKILELVGGFHQLLRFSSPRSTLYKLALTHPHSEFL